MPPIVVIAPESTSYQIVQRVATELGIQDKILLHLTGLSRSLNVARKAEEEGAYVIVARGWSANQIVEAGIRTPLVFLPISMQDLVYVLDQALAKAAKPNPRVGFIVYPQLQKELVALSSLLHVDLRIYPSGSDKEDMRRAIAQAVRDKVDVFIGGETSIAMAESMGLCCQLLVCDEMSIRQALLEAKRIVYARELEQAQSLKFKTVIEHSHDGIVSLDAEGRVLLINPVARRMLRLKNDITHFSYRAILDLPQIDRCLLLGNSIEDEMAEVEGRKLLFSAIPIHVGDTVHGAVITFQEPRAIAAKESKIRHDAMHAEMLAQHRFEDIIGSSPAIAAAVARARKFAPSAQPVLIQGETGTGKELFAQSIHNASPRRDQPFVAINCGALPQSLLESELFGYEEGAFTGASRKGKPGLFELAHNGTLFLDEVAELDLRAQRRLLRVLETQRVLRISGTRNICVDVRIIAATNANLWERVKRNQFRADLFYRLSVLVVSLPPLRERQGDVERLMRHFLAHAEGDVLRGQVMDPQAQEMLCNYAWPGNIRELRYFIHRLCATMPDTLDAATMQTELLMPFECPRSPLHSNGANDASCVNGASGADANPCAIAGSTAQDVSTKDPFTTSPAHTPSAGEVERDRIVQALLACHGHQGKAALMLHMSRSTLFRKMRKFGIR